MPSHKRQGEHEGFEGELFEVEEKIVEKLPVSERSKGKILVILDIIVNILIIAALVFTVRRFLISPFQVYGPSMCNTLNYFEGTCHKGFGEYLIVNKAVYQKILGFSIGAPSRGDIIVFHPYKGTKDFYIKRVIGVPGDTIEIRGGKVYLSNENHPKGLELPEPYLSNENQGKTSTFSNKAVMRYKVPEGTYFALGDNRRESTDSRSCFKAPFSLGCEGNKFFLDQKLIEGKAWVVLWPFSKVRILKNPVYETAGE